VEKALSQNFDSMEACARREKRFQQCDGVSFLQSHFVDECVGKIHDA
jgi:hypothetical protein